MFGWGDNCISVTNGAYGTCRSVHERIDNGTVIIRAKTMEGAEKTVIVIQNEQIKSKRTTVDGRLRRYIKYGEVEKVKGRMLLRFREGTNRALDGLCTRYDEKIFGYSGVLKTFYKRGRLVWQKFYHENKHICYHFNSYKNDLIMKHPDGKVLYNFKGKIYAARVPEGTFAWNATFWGQRDKFDWTKDGNCSFVQYDQAGRIVNKGEFQNRQKVGDWIVNRQKMYFINGMMVPKKLYDTPPEKLDPEKILLHPSADTRSVLINRMGAARFAELPHEIIHVDEKGKMKLMKITVGKNGSSRTMNILQVTCPSTKQEYFLRVPPYIEKCEEGRQWTFGVEDPERQRIRFDVET